MNYVGRVQEVNTAQKVIEDMKNLFVTEALRSVTRENLLQVQVDEVDHEKYLVERFKRADAQVFLVRYYYVVQFSGKQIIAHFG